MMKLITLCADDYALNEAVSQGIIRLVATERLTAVSCMTTSPHWSQHAPWLHPYREKTDLGLHFNLTEGQPLSGKTSSIARQGTFLSLPLLVTKAHLRSLKVVDIEQELLLQLQQFVQHMQCLPDFIDGHQHIHHLPVIREALLKVYQQHLREKRAYIRISLQRRPRGNLKSLILAVTGAVKLQYQLQKLNIPYNAAFSGIYPFQDAMNYRQYFIEFLRKAENQQLIMCHPGLENRAEKDAIAFSRFQELTYLNSAAFNEDCEQYHVKLTRLTL
jgi:predicted glycoside hydrolase/deacetylase ChbG (UPF0249 family)